MADDLKSVTLQVYNPSRYTFCFDNYQNLRTVVAVTYADGTKLRPRARTIQYRPSPVEGECVNHVLSGEVMMQAWDISDDFPRIAQKPFSICYDLTWGPYDRDGAKATAIACSRVQRLPNGKLKVLPQPTRIIPPATRGFRP